MEDEDRLHQRPFLSAGDVDGVGKRLGTLMMGHKVAQPVQSQVFWAQIHQLISTANNFLLYMCTFIIP
jgi:hypothetical protein